MPELGCSNSLLSSEEFQFEGRKAGALGSGLLTHRELTCSGAVVREPESRSCKGLLVIMSKKETKQRETETDRQ